MNEYKSRAKQCPRRTIAFYDDNLSFCQAEAQRKHLSVTQYINQLVDDARAQQGSASPTSKNRSATIKSLKSSEKC